MADDYREAAVEIGYQFIREDSNEAAGISRTDRRRRMGVLRAHETLAPAYIKALTISRKERRPIYFLVPGLQDPAPVETALAEMLIPAGYDDHWPQC